VPAAHLHEAGVRRGDQRIRLRRVDADQHPALAARCHGHVPADQEGEPAEHLLLGHAGFAADLLPDAVGEVLVVGHAPIVRHAPDVSCSPAATGSASCSGGCPASRGPC
jgi:hypothetical protein